MTTYQPQPGDHVHVTIAGTVTDHPDLGFMSVITAEKKVLHIQNYELVRVEPAPAPLPTGDGARIRATICGGARRRLIRMFDAAITDEAHWFDDQGGRWADHHLTNVTVLDPGEVDQS